MTLQSAMLPLFLAASLANARDEPFPTPVQAERNLVAAERELARAGAAFKARHPSKRGEFDANTAEWRKRMEAGCAQEDAGGNSASAARSHYAREVQCAADALLNRAKSVRAVLTGS